VPLDTVESFSFHKSLVQNIRAATPVSTLATQSRNVVAIMEAAEESALANAMPVTPNIKTP
jgi:hypothetical protein